MVGGASILEVRGWVEAPVNTMATGSGLRDRDLRKTMEADIFPNIRFQLEDVTLQWERGDSAAVTLAGRFFIHGVTRVEPIPALVSRTPDGTRVTATFPMNLHDYQIDRLTRFLLFKMRPDIVVHVDVKF